MDKGPSFPVVYILIPAFHSGSNFSHERGHARFRFHLLEFSFDSPAKMFVDSVTETEQWTGQTKGHSQSATLLAHECESLHNSHSNNASMERCSNFACGVLDKEWNENTLVSDEAGILCERACKENRSHWICHIPPATRTSHCKVSPFPQGR